MKAFHFTSSMHLPWILSVGELRPSLNRIGDFPSPDLVWATTDANGDRTATARTAHAAYRAGKMMLVRITFDASEFFSWSEVLDRFPQWTSRHVASLEHAAQTSGANPATWLCRSEALKLDRANAIDVRSFRNNVWRPVKSLEVRKPSNSSDWLVMEIDGKPYASQRTNGDKGAEAFTPGELTVSFRDLSIVATPPAFRKS